MLYHPTLLELSLVPMTAVLSRSMDLDNSFTIYAESLTMKVRLRDQELMFQVTGLEMVVIGLSESLYCLVDGSFNERGKHFSYLFEDKSVRSEGWVLDLEMLKKKHL